MKTTVGHEDPTHESLRLGYSSESLDLWTLSIGRDSK
jgi:hypothetical protein